MSNECIPYFADATQVTAVAGTAGIGGKLFVVNSGPLAAGLGISGGVPAAETAAAEGVPVMGVGAQDNASGLAGGVFVAGTVPVIAGAAISAGDAVMTNAVGQAIPYALGTAPAFNVIAGVCIGDTASGADAPIKIRE